MFRVEDIRPLSDELVQLSDPGHIYTVGEGLTERVAPSLSRVLANAGLVTDYSGVDPDHLAFRSAVGTYVHAWIESYFNDDYLRPEGDPFVALHAAPHIDAFIAWVENHELIPAYLESPAYQPVHRYACTEDFIGLLDGELAVIDHKTTAKISKTVGLQTMGQAMCFDYRGAIAPFKRYALHLPKKGRAKLVPFTDDARDRAVVEAAALCMVTKGSYVA